MRLNLTFLIFSSLLVASVAYGETDLDALSTHPEWSDVELIHSSESNNYSSQIPLEVVVLKDSSWTRKMVMDEIRRAQSIYSQCGVEFSPVTVIAAFRNDGPNLEYKYDIDYLNDGLFADRPVAFLVQEEVTEGYGKSYSWRASDKQKFAERVGSIFINYKAFRANKASRQVDPNYSVLAHELAHILFDQGHNHSEGNILCGSGDCKGTEITHSQCDSISSEFFR